MTFDEHSTDREAENWLLLDHTLLGPGYGSDERGRRSVSSARNCSLVLRITCCSDRSGTVMVTGLPVRGSNRVMVIWQLPPADLQCATSVERCAVPGKAHLPWIVCWSCAE